MRPHTPASQQERLLPTGIRLITVTDPQGTITYCNDEFATISGFDRETLLGSPHNIVRHPDMPGAVFAQMWHYLKAGKPWMGIVKNRCQNGDFYWVDAYVTPIFADGRISGYESVRVKPQAEQVRRASQLYAQMNKGGAKDASALSPWRIASLCAWPLVAALLALAAYHYASPLAGVGCALAALPALQGWNNWRQTRLLQHVQSSLEGAFDDTLSARAYTDARGRQARLQMSLISERARLRTLLGRLTDFARQSMALAQRSARLTSESETSLQEQRKEADMTATAIHEMAASISEVATHVQQTADEASRIGTLAHNGSAEAGKTREVIERLANSVAGISASVEELAQDTQSIQQAADMIRAIAEQTNLLALNAAIEAARAGDQGRGFAVVADEVRALASKTRDSTAIIQQIIETLQERAANAVEIARTGTQEADDGVRQVITTQQALQEVGDAIELIHDMSQQMAVASEQQAHVAEDISRQITRIADASDVNAGLAEESAQAGEELEQTAHDMYALVERFSSQQARKTEPGGERS